ncbi:hypothetical protein KSP40_PGU001765 [Platanthera guangdongensis]|uniref:Uncharacterized protein n=1 Tax=Platanthera guangdongensis TaxID=2320717 RepID=A0ABR2M1P8_9ASPA
MVESSSVQVFWDVHDWLFGGLVMGHALFIFLRWCAGVLLYALHVEGGLRLQRWRGCGFAMVE